MQIEVELVDIGMGNTGSVKRCLERLDIRYTPVNRSLSPTGDRPLVLPGVGAFGEVIDRLKENELSERIPELIRKGTPYLGICVGMQILFDSSEESPGHKGFGLIPGKVVKFKQGKVPQIGWNRIASPSGNGKDSGYVYFVNSYYPQPLDAAVTSYEADYFGKFCAAVNVGNMTAMQFHPEKSGEFGARLLKRWTENASK